MMIEMMNQPDASPKRLLEMLAARFGAFEAAAESTLKLARLASADELSMDTRMADALLDFGADLRAANDRAAAWTCIRNDAAGG